MGRRNKQHFLPETNEVIARLEAETGCKWKWYKTSYYFSEQGGIYNQDGNLFLKPTLNFDDKGDPTYSTIDLYYKGKKENKKIYPIIARLFCKRWRYESKPKLLAHHINQNKTDDRAANLIWLTYRQHRIIHNAPIEEVNTEEKLRKYLDKCGLPVGTQGGLTTMAAFQIILKEGAFEKVDKTSVLL